MIVLYSLMRAGSIRITYISPFEYGTNEPFPVAAVSHFVVACSSVLVFVTATKKTANCTKLGPGVD